MNSKFLKPFLQYTLSLAIAVGVLWFVLKDVAIEEMLGKVSELNYFWIGVSLFCALLGYGFRVYRWNLLLAPLGYRPGFLHTFLATMIGYLANLVLPRFGEVVRCGVLKRSDNVPVSTSLGTVVAERVFDLFFLVLIVVATLFLEFDKLSAFLGEVFSGGSRMPAVSAFIYIGAGLLIAVFLGVWYYQRNKAFIREHAFYKKLSSFLKELLSGVLSVRELESRRGFWLSSSLIWVMYYLMSYVIVFSLPQTSGIDVLAGLAILAMGGIGMAAPVQGGLGTYHLLVSGVLMVYGASKNDAVLLAFVLHTSQTIFVIVTGVISLLVSFIINRKKPVAATENA